ncbi:phenazine biosynthesis protein PhzF family [Wallemia mellicola]|nr:phenazine biosynthesis protein PhzF family [Wallemia mellicola]
MAGNTHKFNQVDVFTDTPYYGNPVAVVTVNGSLSDSQMQRFANWTNLSETTFITPSDKADYYLKIFTPASELPFAGHPTLGSAYVYLNSLKEEERQDLKNKGGTITQECGIGIVHLKWDYRTNLLSFQAPPLLRSDDVEQGHVEKVCKCMGISRDDVIDAKWVENGPPWFGIQLKNAQKVLDAAITDKEIVSGLYFGLFGEYEEEKSDVKFEVRAFAPLADGVGEDPVTGSFNAGIAKWIQNQTPKHYFNSQGTKLGRRGRVSVTEEGGEIYIGGNVSECIAGNVII